MFYLIGLGLNKESLSEKAKKIILSCTKVYLEDYTVNFPYEIQELEQELGIGLNLANREFVESESIIDEAKNEDVALLVYGSPLTATTHISLIKKAKEQNVAYKIEYNSSIFDSIAETGLQIYKFGKVTSIPKWTNSYKPTSFMETVKQNQRINAHSLLLVDIGLELKDTLNELKIAAQEYNIPLNKIIVCSNLGTENSKILYEKIEDLVNLEVEKPYCIILHSELHFLEKEILEDFSI